MNQHVKSVSSEEDSEQIVFVIDDDESMRVALIVKIHRGHMMKKMEARSLADLGRKLTHCPPGTLSGFVCRERDRDGQVSTQHQVTRRKGDVPGLWDKNRAASRVCQRW